MDADAASTAAANSTTIGAVTGGSLDDDVETVASFTATEKAFEIVLRLSCLLGFLGALCIVLETYADGLVRRRQNQHQQRSSSLRNITSHKNSNSNNNNNNNNSSRRSKSHPTINRLLFLINALILVETLAFGFGSTALNKEQLKWPKWGAVGNQTTCNLQGYFGFSAVVLVFFWDAVLSVAYVLLVCHTWSRSALVRYERIMHAWIWIVVLALTTTLLFTGTYNWDGGNNCWMMGSPLGCGDKDDPEEEYEPCARGALAAKFSPAFRFVHSFAIFTSLCSMLRIYWHVRMQEKRVAKYKYDFRSTAASSSAVAASVGKATADADGVTSSENPDKTPCNTANVLSLPEDSQPPTQSFRSSLSMSLASFRSLPHQDSSSSEVKSASPPPGDVPPPEAAVPTTTSGMQQDQQQQHCQQQSRSMSSVVAYNGIRYSATIVVSTLPIITVMSIRGLHDDWPTTIILSLFNLHGAFYCIMFCIRRKEMCTWYGRAVRYFVIDMWTALWASSSALR